MIDLLKNNGEICINYKAMYVISDFLTRLKPFKTILHHPSLPFDILSYDSRKIKSGQRCLFFALKGQKDGHRYIADAYEAGVRNFVLSDAKFEVDGFAEGNFLWVDDTLVALQEIALQHRESIDALVIGITGSNGKTIVKEWLTQLLQIDKKVYQSPKSYNSQLGVALSLWNLHNDFDVALIEAGISKTGEMERLERIIEPKWGIFTSLGTAHREGFPSKEVKLEEKWKLFEKVEKIIVPSGQLSVDYLIDERIVSWGNLSEDKLYVNSMLTTGQSTLVNLSYNKQDFKIEIPFSDKASIENILTCILTMLEMGYTSQTICERISNLRHLDMRLQLKKGKNNSSIIDDTYSNDLASLSIALDFLNQQNQNPRKKLILSDFEGEAWTEKFQLKLQALLSSVHLDEIIFIGERFTDLKLKIPSQVRVFNSTDDLISDLSDLDLSNAVVLIKGARKYKLELISRKLVEKSHETVFQINLQSLEHNLKQYRSIIAPQVKMMAMVKAFSYGSGSFEVANVLQFNNVDYLTVAFVDEGSELRRAGVKLPIMVLSPHESTFEDVVLYSLEPEIYSVRILKSFVEFLSERNIVDYPIHIKLDTGMHRLGFMENEVDELMLILQEHRELKVISVFSHLVGAGSDVLKEFTNRQITVYNKMVNKIKKVLEYDFIRHICNTSGIVHHPEAHMDMVRLGIGLYGFDSNSKDLNLEEVGLLKTTITQIKHLKADDTVGYDRKGVLKRDSKIATVKIGYADGYSRRFGNGVGEMLINGKLAPTVGNICMDMCMLDITDIDAQEGDEVIVFPDVHLVAQRIGTIPYELLTGISTRVKRVYFYE
ncbi:bifunctional UDP-N-acetylmuramoyl-tripeptide:D-alanyl-D-alanine ligase/alanine racemase [Sphingobacterium composti Ten et al. 2007 non Yoo et al. 2007]|uniref:bifunctional UDP-N-acetylmuramoyl-tripeptide:D-alanyl-D-alanine ligase/alanine racemase n=1 Tax=Sphingobacterium composti TaxID=363260 RepID=UPI001F15E570|nr:bifunctional UDP-N-acetylmuramoyl-tripeptide:D-alanyl-D-alanine ligase/alanine racemase [Sphingobacterium composti Ten et al. 2007 non Yoo et al. 2007]